MRVDFHIFRESGIVNVKAEACPLCKTPIDINHVENIE